MGETYDEWSKYLEELYSWINSLYEAVLSGDLTEKEYNQNLDYYNSEVQRVNDLRIQKKKKGVNPEEIEKYFFGRKEPRIIGELKTPKVDIETKPGQRIKDSLRMQPTVPKGMDLPKNVSSSPEPTIIAPKEDKSTPKPVSTNRFKKYEPTPIGEIRTVKIDRSKKYIPVSNDLTPKPLSSRPVQSPRPKENMIQRAQSQPQTKDIVQEISKSLVDDITSKKEDMRSVTVVLLGNSGVGRTSIRRSFMGKNFVTQHLSTVGASMDEREIKSNGNTIRVVLSDLGGQDFYKSVRLNFYRSADAAIIVFDLSDQSTFTSIEKWIVELYQNSKNKHIPFVLVGNKSDLKRKIRQRDIENYINELSKQTIQYGFMVPYVEVSAKDGKNIEEIFSTLLTILK